MRNYNWKGHRIGFQVTNERMIQDRTSNTRINVMNHVSVPDIFPNKLSCCLRKHAAVTTPESSRTTSFILPEQCFC